MMFRTCTRTSISTRSCSKKSLHSSCFTIEQLHCGLMVVLDRQSEPSKSFYLWLLLPPTFVESVTNNGKLKLALYAPFGYERHQNQAYGQSAYGFSEFCSATLAYSPDRNEVRS